MTRPVVFAIALALTAPVVMPVPVAAAPAAAKLVPWSVETTKIGKLIDNPEAKAIFVKHLPMVANGGQLWMARGMTLRQIQKYSHGYITDEKLAAMDADLKTLTLKALAPMTVK